MKKKLLTLLTLTALLISCKRYDLVGVEKFEDDSFLRAVTINLPKGEEVHRF